MSPPHLSWHWDGCYDDGYDDDDDDVGDSDNDGDDDDDVQPGRVSVELLHEGINSLLAPFLRSWSIVAW